MKFLTTKQLYKWVYKGIFAVSCARVIFEGKPTTNVLTRWLSNVPSHSWLLPCTCATQRRQLGSFEPSGYVSIILISWDLCWSNEYRRDMYIGANRRATPSCLILAYNIVWKSSTCKVLRRLCLSLELFLRLPFRQTDRSIGRWRPTRNWFPPEFLTLVSFLLPSLPN